MMNKYYWATNFTREGLPYQVLATACNEMRIPQRHIKATIYVYSSEQNARAGVPAGGSGFFVGMPTGRPDQYFVYAVTNAHVIAGCSEFPYIRVNKEGGGFQYVGIPKSSWQLHPHGDDIAVAQLGGLSQLDLDVGIIPTTDFVTQENLLATNMHLGAGDPTYMVGRFTSHEGVSVNTPIVRYGNISLNPDKQNTVWNSATKHDDEVFLIEARSVSGYSGSAVFTYINELDYRDKIQEITEDTNLIPKQYFLGINIGHTQMMKPVQVLDPDKPSQAEYQDLEVDGYGRLYSEYNSGIMRIAPAWKLQEVLDMEVFADMRKKVKKQVEDEKRKVFTLDSLPPEKRDSVSISRNEFEATLQKVSRKIISQKPDSSKPKT